MIIIITKSGNRLWFEQTDWMLVEYIMRLDGEDSDVEQVYCELPFRTRVRYGEIRDKI